MGTALLDVLRRPLGERPRRVFVDPQRKGTEEIDAVRAVEQQQFFAQIGIGDLLAATRTTLTEEPA